MKAAVLFKFVFLPLVVILPVSRTAESSSSTLGVFAGTSLCADVSRPLLNIPAGAQCDRNKWNLTLYVDANTQAPTTYKLSSEYGYHVDNRTFLTKGSNVREGKWTIVKGARADPNAAVYQLDPDKPGTTISFQRVDPYIIHLLERDGTLAIGSAAQSFTLSNVNKHSEVANPASKVILRTSAAALTEAANLAPAVVFAGRTPCREVAQQLNHHPADGDCRKLKWEVTIYQEAKTRTSGRFKLRGTLFRDFDRAGNWTRLQGRQGDPSAIVYKLDFDKDEGSLLLFKADDNILFFLHNDRSLMVGNQDFSYTLNREKL